MSDMQAAVPSQCPECGDLDVRVLDIPPDKHGRGEEWLTRADCRACDFTAWFG